ncbi:hypothetical protein PQX77_002734 [Marasmius sp. AFHP31]|nr:hypothetical protein PQX77_002734 [Marasmius sp. AFHP31]
MDRNNERGKQYSRFSASQPNLPSGTKVSFELPLPRRGGPSNTASLSNKQLDPAQDSLMDRTRRWEAQGQPANQQGEQAHRDYQGLGRGTTVFPPPPVVPDYSMFSNASRFTIVGGLFANVGRDVVNAQETDNTDVYLDQYLRGFCCMNASFNAGKRDPGIPRCIPGTRTEVIDTILKWISDPYLPGILLLIGLAGEGKSAVAQTIAEGFSTPTHPEEPARLASSFFFSRGHDDRCQTGTFFTTLAYQLTLYDPDLKSFILSALREDSSLPHTNVAQQVLKLIINPILAYNNLKVHQKKAPPPHLLFVIDALDECDDPISILTAIADALMTYGKLFRVLITSRPESQIMAFFSRLKVPSILRTMSLQDYDSGRDVETYLGKSFSNIRTMNPGIFRKGKEEWPGQSMLKRLVVESDGLFAHASSIVKYVSHGRESPIQRLQRLLDLHTPALSSTTTHTTTSKGNLDLKNPYKPLDKLYTDILSAVEGPPSHLHDILGALTVLYAPLPEPELALLMISTCEELSEDVLSSIINQLHSILSSPSNAESTWETQPIELYHNSVHSFLAEKRRSAELYISPVANHIDMAIRCLKVMSLELKHNICQIEQHHYGIDHHRIEGLAELCDQHIPGHLRYACQFWWRHTLSANIANSGDAGISHELQLRLGVFLRSSLLQWIECLSLLGDLSLGLQAMGSLEEQVKEARINNHDFKTS